MACLGGKAGIALAKVCVRDIRIAVFLDTRLEIDFALIVAVGAEARAFKVLRRQPNSLPVGFGPLQHRRDMAIILAVAKRSGMQNNLVFGIDEGLAIVPLQGAMSRLHFCRVVVSDVAL